MKKNPVKRFVLWLIKKYQTNVSPNFPAMCRFVPTCSQYALTAVERFGVVKGTALALWRIVRCNPLSKGGYDPVPQKRGQENSK